MWGGKGEGKEKGEGRGGEELSEVFVVDKVDVLDFSFQGRLI